MIWRRSFDSTATFTSSPTNENPITSQGTSNIPLLHAGIGQDSAANYKHTPIPQFVIPIVVALAFGIVIGLCTIMWHGKKMKRRRERGKYVEYVKKSRFPMKISRILPLTNKELANGDSGKRKVRIVKPERVPERNTGGSSSWTPPGKINDRYRAIIEYFPVKIDELFVSSGDIFQVLEFFEDGW
jgi:hypothetical protein